MTNSYSSFEFEKVPEYTAQLDRRFKEEAEGDKLVEAQLVANNRMREKDADANAKTWQALNKLAPQAAEAFSKTAQAMDKRWEAEAKLLMMKAGVDWQDYAEYKTEDGDNIDFNKVQQKIANDLRLKAEEPGADSSYYLELADEFANASGRKLKRIGRLAIHRAANNLDTIANNHLHEIELADGTTWANAKPTDKERVLDELLVQKGLDTVLPYSDGLLKYDSGFADKVMTWKDNKLKADSIQYTAHIRDTDLIQAKDELEEACKVSGEQCYIAYQEAVEDNYGHFNRTDTKRIETHEHFKGVLEDLVVNGDVPGANIGSMLDHLVEHRGMKKTDGTYTKVPAHTFMNIDNKQSFINELTRKVEAQKTVENKDFVDTVGAKLMQDFRDKGGQIYEAELDTFETTWKSNPKTKHLPLPEQYKTLRTKTVEDYGDKGIEDWAINIMESGTGKLDINRIYYIQDGELRNKLLEQAQTYISGLSKEEVKTVNRSLTKLSKEKLGLEFGESGDTPKVEQMTKSALHNYMKYYSEGKTKFETAAAAQEWAFDRVKTEISEGIHKTDQRGIDISKDYFNKMEAIRSFARKNPSNFLHMGVLPGTKADFAQLQKFAENPNRAKFPAIYAKLADTYRIYTPLPEGSRAKRRKLHGYEWAQIQYKNETGKDLPPLTGTLSEKLEDEHWVDFFNCMMTSKAAAGVNAVISGTVDNFLTEGVG